MTALRGNTSSHQTTYAERLANNKKMQIEFQMARTVHSVSEITDILSRLIQQQPHLQNVWVQGQVSNYRCATSGHSYFTLKDPESQIRCVFFRGKAARLRFQPSDGDEVLVQGKLNIYIPYGAYQIDVNTIEPRGIGAMQRAFEALKRQLAAEGLFDERHKQPRPQFPQKIGVVTSEKSKAINDIREGVAKRYPLAELWLYPTLVQGEHAAGQIAHAIRVMNQRDDIDVLIVGRGGGSIEDLWAFNEEIVARAIFASKIPVVSAVGHEDDYTISDAVADYRASTPATAPGEILRDREELLAQLSGTEAQLHGSIAQKIDNLDRELTEIKTSLSPAHRMDVINQHHQTVDNLEAACRAAGEHRLSDAQHTLHTLAQRLNTLSPLGTLKRGYSITRNENAEVLTDAEQIAVGEQIAVQLSQGHLTCKVVGKKAALSVDAE